MFAASKTDSASTGGYQISRSLRFNRPDTAYLNRTPASSGNQQTWTYSTWIKRGSLDTNQFFFSQQTGSSDTGYFGIFLTTGNTLSCQGWISTWRVTTQVFRDVSAWYHIVVAVDTTQATANNRIRIYVNGSEITSFTTTTNPTQNANTGVNGTGAAYVGKEYNSSGYFDGYTTETYLIDGQALTPSSFGETNAQTGVWQPKAYSGSYGTNGFYLNFSDNSNTTAATLGKDYSGNGNNWTPNNFSVTAGAGNDSLVDSPTSYSVDTGVGGTVRGNYATMNPLNKGSAITLANGNLDVTQTTTKGKVLSTIGVTSGKWYWEITAIPVLTYGSFIGLAQGNSSLTVGVGEDANSWAYANNGSKFTNNSGTSYGTAYTLGGTIGVSFDADTGTLAFYLNGTAQGTAYTGLTSGPYFPAVGNDGFSYTANFGQRPFAYTAPSGFKALCTQNLPTPTIGATTATQAGKFFNAVTYTGTGANPRTITGVGFQPDWVWGKTRSTVNNNLLFDVVRGVSSTSALGLLTDTTGAEANYYTLNGGVTAFTSDGFTVSGGSTNNNLNSNGVTYVAWNWKANGSGSTNTSGSITSTVSANTTSGFSIVTYTGTGANGTVGHGLGVAPKMVITKARNNTGDWGVYNKNIGAANALLLQATNASTNIPTWWNSTDSTSTVFSLGTSSTVNASGYSFVAYCFAEIVGYSSLGQYTGNGSSDGTFVFTGMRPAYLMLKRTDNTSDWFVYDATRSPYNAASTRLYPDLSAAEDTGGSTYDIDFLSNGFKLRGTGQINISGSTWIFMAFASNPFKFSLAR
jgi:hypothetical protein